MATTMTNAAPAAKQIRTQQTVFDLESKDNVTLYKVGEFTPVTTMQDFVARLGNDSAKILEIINDGLKAFELAQLEKNGEPWMVEGEDGALTPFAGVTISEEKSKQFAANVLNMAKMLFGYNKDMTKEDKRKAKDQAEAMLLGNPAVIEALKKA